MNKLIAFVVGVSLLVGVTFVSNVWLGVAAAGAWTLLWRTRGNMAQQRSLPADSANSSLERLEKWRVATEDGFSLFVGVPIMAIGALLIWLIAEIDIKTYGLLDGETWIFAAACFAVGWLIRSMVFRILFARLYARYPSVRQNSEVT